WVTGRIWSEKKEEAIRTLQQYTHNKRTSEVMGELINQLHKNDALMAIYELKNKPTIVCTSGNHQMDIKAVVSTINTFQTFEVKALLDSGCMGSCINQDSVNRHQLNTTPLPQP
ncbi:hypothetical protein AMATHDRAFT_134011, partial [Amanita thiersii Skay4041]